MQINRERHDLNKMAGFLYENGVREMVEVGSFYGVSTEIFRDAGITVHSVDPYESGYDKDDGASDQKVLENAYSYFTENVLDNKTIFHTRKKSSDAIGDFETNSLDFVYIDANHKYDSVVEDIKLWLPKVKKGMFFGGDDYPRIDASSGKTDVQNAVKDTLGEPYKMFHHGHWLFKINNEI